jgi:signal transduction histidine kinase
VQQTASNFENEKERADREVPLARGLSTKLLFLTILFVMLAEVLIFLPSVAEFRIRWLEERLATAAAVGIVLVESDPASLSREVQDDVLLSLGAKAVALRDEGSSQLLVITEMPPHIDAHIDLDNTARGMALYDALSTLFFGGEQNLRVFGSVGQSGREFEVVMADAELRSAMLVYAREVAVVSFILSLITATLVFYAINRIMIRPIRTMTRSMLGFSQAPEDPRRVIRAGSRDDEIGVAERELAAMQSALQQTLAQQKHLADLGLAVSKINHDMRNTLAAAQLISDRLASVKDPLAQSLAPKLVRALDRAVSYTEGVLAYGRAQEAPPSRRRIRLHLLVAEVHGLLNPGADPAIEFVNAVDPDFEVDADAEQLFRVLSNLSRNAIEAMTGNRDSAVVSRLIVRAEREGLVCRIFVEDTGPGLPAKARENLFTAFRGSARSGGTGLGLAIAQELVRAHGGAISLAESRGGRTVFEIMIPDQPVDIEAARFALRRPA